jgi:hypothetical protein
MQPRVDINWARSLLCWCSPTGASDAPLAMLALREDEADVADEVAAWLRRGGGLQFGMQCNALHTAALQAGSSSLWLNIQANKAASLHKACGHHLRAAVRMFRNWRRIWRRLRTCRQPQSIARRLQDTHHMQ